MKIRIIPLFMCDDYKDDDILFFIFNCREKELEQDSLVEIEKENPNNDSLAYEKAFLDLDDLLNNEKYQEINKNISKIAEGKINQYEFLYKLPVIESLYIIYQTIGEAATDDIKTHSTIQTNILKIFSKLLYISKISDNILLNSEIINGVYQYFLSNNYPYELIKFYTNLINFACPDEIVNYIVDLIQQFSSSEDVLLQKVSLILFHNFSFYSTIIPKTSLLPLAMLAIKLSDSCFSDLAVSALCNLSKASDFYNLKGYLKAILMGLTSVSTGTRIKALYLARKAFLELDDESGEELFLEVDMRVFTSALLSSDQEEAVQCARLIQSVDQLQETVGYAIIESGTLYALLGILEEANFRFKESIVAMLCTLAGHCAFPDLIQILGNHGFAQMLTDVALNTSRTGVAIIALETAILMFKKGVQIDDEICSIIDTNFDNDELDALKEEIENMFATN